MIISPGFYNEGRFFFGFSVICRIVDMKKLFLYIFLGLILCNTGFARTTGCTDGDCEDGVGTWTYTDPKINVISMEKLNDKYTIVSSILVATEKTPEVKIDWRVYTKTPSKFLIRDLIIEGLSVARTQKEEFNSVIQSNDGDLNSLFTNLTEFINK